MRRRNKYKVLTQQKTKKNIGEKVSFVALFHRNKRGFFSFALMRIRQMFRLISGSL